MYQEFTKRKNLLTIAMLLCFCAFTNKVMGQTWDISDKSTTGNSVTAVLNGNTLTISGTGNMADFDVSAGGIPWNNYLTQIKTVIINSGVTNIGNIAFQGCSNLQTITIPSTVTIIGYRAFYNCTNPNLQIIIPNSVTEIEGEAFRNCNLSMLRLENGSEQLKFIGYSYQYGLYTYDWFKNCQIKTLHLGRNYISDLSYPPFRGISALQTLIIGNTVTFIDYNYAFADCTSLTNVTIEDGSSTLNLNGMNIFDQSPIKTLYLGRNYSADWGGTSAAPFYSKTSLISLTIGSYVTSIIDNAFYGCSGLTAITIPNSVTSIGSSAFNGCIVLSAATIGSNVKTIGASAFNQCSALISITIPKSVTSIDNSAFANCTSLTNVTIEDGSSTLNLNGMNIFNQSPIKTLYLGRNYSAQWGGTSAAPFYSKTSLTSLTIGSYVTSIIDNAFYGCSGLTQITSKNPSPPIIGNGYYKAFDGVNKTTCKLYVPDGAVNDYKAAFEWKEFFNILPTAIAPIKAYNIKIFPNPVKDELIIENGNLDRENEKIQIIDFSGRIVISSQFSPSGSQLKINVSHLPSGVYILRIGSYTSKFVKE